MPSVLQVFTISAIKCFVILLIRAGGQDGSIGRGVRGGCVPTQSLGRYPRSAWVADRIFPSQTNRSLSAARRARRLSRFGCATPAMPAKGCKGGGREARDKIRSQDKVARGQVQSFRKLPNPVILRALIKSGAHKAARIAVWEDEIERPQLASSPRMSFHVTRLIPSLDWLLTGLELGLRLGVDVANDRWQAMASRRAGKKGTHNRPRQPAHTGSQVLHSA